MPPSDLSRLEQLPRNEAVFVLTMLLVSVPFIWIGVGVTLKRLRSAALPLWFVAFFFVPFANIAFFLILSLIPPREVPETLPRQPQYLARFLPEHPLGAAAMTLIVPLVAGLVFTLLSVEFMRDYGWGIFVAVPFAMGMSAVLLDSARQERGFWRCVGVSLLSVAVLGAALIALAIEGLICVMMAAPIGAVMAIIGGLIGHAIQMRLTRPRDAAVTMLLLGLSVPGVQSLEWQVRGEAPLLAVKTAVEVDAPPEVVWERVVAFASIAPPPGVDIPSRNPNPQG